MRWSRALVAACLVLAACATMPPDVPLERASEELRVLVDRTAATATPGRTVRPVATAGLVAGCADRGLHQADYGLLVTLRDGDAARVLDATRAFWTREGYAVEEFNLDTTHPVLRIETPDFAVALLVNTETGEAGLLGNTACRS